MDTHYDLCIIGGGINGAGIAREATGRGIRTCLIEARDLASGTSSASTKLVHGGLRYLEYYEFSLVRAALKEREVLLSIAPHIIWPMRFILPHDESMRPKWMIRAGLFLYDHLAKRKRLTGSTQINLKKYPLDSKYKTGFSYADCWVDDARLVTLNAMSAKELGADVMTYTRCTGLAEQGGLWRVTLDRGETISAEHVINATGAWCDRFLAEQGLKTPRMPETRLVKGSHIIVPRLYDDDHAFILQQSDGRIVFTIPYEGAYTLIGTTEEHFSADPATARISEDEIDYLINAVNKAFTVKIADHDIKHTYSGVRGLYEDGSKDAKSVTRDYKLHLHQSLSAPMLSIFGGKITTYRVLATKAVDMIFGKNDMSGWTGDVALPGGDIKDFDIFAAEQQKRYPQLDAELVHRYARAYGRLMDKFVSDDMGAHIGDDIYAAELNYVRQYEFAQTAEDFLMRRSKRGLHVSAETTTNVEAWFKINALV